MTRCVIPKVKRATQYISHGHEYKDRDVFNCASNIHAEEIPREVQAWEVTHGGEAERSTTPGLLEKKSAQTA